MNIMKSCFKLLRSDSGFTFVELIAVVTIVGILSYVAAAHVVGSEDDLQYESMLHKIAADVRYAKLLALSDGQGTRVHIDLSENRYYLKWDDGNYVKKPLGAEDFIVQLGTGYFNDVQITATSFTGGRLDFDTRGSALNGGTPFVGMLDLITLNNQKKIRINSLGFLQIKDL